MRTLSSDRQNPAYAALSSDDKSIVDYVHGHLLDPDGRLVAGQRTSAVIYEYARMSHVLSELAAAFQKRGGLPSQVEDEEIVQRIFGRQSETPFIWSWLWIGSNGHFPSRPWRDIPMSERPCPPIVTPALETLSLAQCAHYGAKARDLNDAISAEYTRRLDQASPGAEADAINREHNSPPPAVWNMDDTNQIVVAFFLDTNLSKTELVERFRRWLELPEQSLRLQDARTVTNKSVAIAADRLKDLAIWRLYERYSQDCGQVREFFIVNQKRDSRGKRIPFLDEKRGRGAAARPASASMENRGQPYFLDAVRRAKEFRDATFLFEGWQKRVKAMEASLGIDPRQYLKCHK
jgi:hypothetical protein